MALSPAEVEAREPALKLLDVVVRRVLCTQGLPKDEEQRCVEVPVGATVDDLAVVQPQVTEFKSGDSPVARSISTASRERQICNRPRKMRSPRRPRSSTTRPTNERTREVDVCADASIEGAFRNRALRLELCEFIGRPDAAKKSV